MEDEVVICADFFLKVKNNNIETYNKIRKVLEKAFKELKEAKLVKRQKNSISFYELRD